ncbi:hypothetical protein KUTeg_004981 [Tegillarca granosa]|uniref:Uncharacterized protein n=1 Tax=Tegillarca granosa TaxID=220873 RepID=A0ABQ9FIG6_TEGGR|nr:hypothetical protein KUTeg_004981 [Tegillarca granosa]
MSEFTICSPLVYTQPIIRIHLLIMCLFSDELDVVSYFHDSNKYLRLLLETYVFGYKISHSIIIAFPVRFIIIFNTQFQNNYVLKVVSAGNREILTEAIIDCTNLDKQLICVLNKLKLTWKNSKLQFVLFCLAWKNKGNCQFLCPKIKQLVHY